MLKRILLLAAVAAFGAGAAAYAQTVTYTLDAAQWNNGATCKACGPTYGTVQVDYASATQATVTVNLDDAGRNIFFNQGGPAEDGDAIEFNLPATNFTITPVTSGFEADYAPGSTLYGDFTDGVTCDYKASGGNPAGACVNSSDPELTSLEFTITSNNGTPISFDGGETLFSLAVTDQAGTDPTGDVGVAPTPEPSSLALLGTGILGVVGTLRRRLKA